MSSAGSRFTEEAFVFFTHFPAANFDAGLVFNPPAYEREAGLRRTVLHPVRPPAFTYECCDDTFRVTHVGRHIGVMRPRLGERQVALLGFLFSDPAAR